MRGRGALLLLLLWVLLWIVPAFAQSDEADYDRLLEQADAKLAAGEHKAAVDLYAKAAVLLTSKARPVVGVARCEFERAMAAGDVQGLSRVRSLLREAISREKGYGGIPFLFGEICLVERNHVGAVRSFRGAVLADYRSREARVLLAKSLLWLGADLADDGETTPEQVLDVLSDAERTFRILEGDTDYSEAERAEFERLRRKTLVNLAAVHQRGRNPKRSEEIMRELIRLEPRSREHWFSLGLLLGASNRNAEARAAYEKALEVNEDPDWVEPCRPLGHLKSVAEEVEAADALLRRFLEKRPESWNGWITWGDHLVRHGRFDEAVEAYRESVVVGPDGPDGVRKLYQALRRAGEKARAEKWGKLFRLMAAD